MKKVEILITEILVTVTILICLPNHAIAADASQIWRQLYRDELEQKLNDKNNVFDSFIGVAPVVLIDIDLDGIPELLIGYAQGSSCYSASGYIYTVRDGKLVTLSDKSDEVDMDIEAAKLYYNPTTGETRVENEAYTQNGATDRYYYTIVNSLINGAVKQKYIFRRHECDYDANEYDIYDKQVTKAEYDKARTKWNDGWVQLPDYQVASADLGCIHEDNDTGTYTGYSDSDTVNFLNSYNKILVKAQASSASIIINGKTKKFEVYNIGGNNYLKLRDIALALTNSKKRFSVSWNQVANKISLQTGENYTAVGGELAKGDGLNKVGQVTSSSIILNENAVGLNAYMINDNNYFKLRDIAELMDFGVSWDNATSTVTINTDMIYSD